MKHMQFKQIANLIYRDKFAYLLFGANIINGVVLIFILPQFFSSSSYAILLIQVFSLQFASLFEAGSVLYFLNLVKGKALKKCDAQALITKVSIIQLVFALTANLIYNYLYLKNISGLSLVLISSHIYFSLIAIPHFLKASLEQGYEVAQKFKALQALVVTALMSLIIFIKPMEGILIYSYAAASFVTFIAMKLLHPVGKNAEEYTFFTAVKYAALIVSSSIGWLFVNFVFANSLQRASEGKIGQLWLLYRMADTLLGARFANRISEYLQGVAQLSYLMSFYVTFKKEIIPFFILVVPLIIISLFISSIGQALTFAFWLILNRANSVYNIFILPDYHYKNMINTVILVVSGVLFSYLIPSVAPIYTLIFMWIVLCFSNLLYGSGVKK